MTYNAAYFYSYTSFGAIGLPLQEEEALMTGLDGFASDNSAPSLVREPDTTETSYSETSRSDTATTDLTTFSEDTDADFDVRSYSDPVTQQSPNEEITQREFASLYENTLSEFIVKIHEIEDRKFGACFAPFSIWSIEDDMKIFSFGKNIKNPNWEELQLSYTPHACATRYKTLREIVKQYNPSVWSEKEEKILEILQKIFPRKTPMRWKKIGYYHPTRTNSQCQYHTCHFTP